MSVKNKTDKLIALVGLESVGKSALFRHMTGYQTGIETKCKRINCRSYAQRVETKC